MGSSSDFDFWLGEWRVTWDEGRARGRNSIAREYGGNVVYERFDGRPGIDLVGMSVSVYREAVDRWFQTWVDDSGNYFALHGGMEDGEMVLLGELSGPRGRVSLRMRYLGYRGRPFHVALGVVEGRRWDVGAAVGARVRARVLATPSTSVR